MAIKKVVLLGDSIRMGYEPFVRARLKAVAEVWGPAENCRHSVEHLFSFNSWYINQSPDVIHFNVGLWDCRRIGWEHEASLVPLETYLRNLELIVSMLRANSGARLIWATTSPVLQERIKNKTKPYRVSTDVDRYNAAATAIFTRENIPVNDLAKFVLEKIPKDLIGEDGVHYTEAGYEMLGDEVSRKIEQEVAKIS